MVPWRGDTFALPEGGLQLARGAACAHRAFRVARCMYGFQFHFGVEEALVAASAERLPPGITIDREHRRMVERAGGSLPGRFFAATTARLKGERKS